MSEKTIRFSKLKKITLTLVLIFAFTAAATLTCSASDKDQSGKEKDFYTKPLKLKGFNQKDLSVTKHEIIIKGKPLKYTATTGYMPIKDKMGKKLKARIFFTAYVKDGEDRTKRPITFAFNGGPGSASIWLHFGALGPKRVHLTKEGKLPPPPYEFLDNQETWLEFTDLVFIDPVDTGYSRLAEEKYKKDFFGVQEDVESVADFIRLYITVFRRWPSPKYIAGESYGATRAAGLASQLQGRLSIHLNGLVMISEALSYQTFVYDFRDNDLPYVLFLPSYAATAMYHKKLSPELMRDFQGTLRAVEKWSFEKYSVALLKGNSISRAEKQAVAEKLSEYTGLSVDYILDNNLRIMPHRFRKNLLKKKILGYYDGRLSVVDPDPSASDRANVSDPSSFLGGAFASSINQYIREDLKYVNDLPYNSWSWKAMVNWNWKSSPQRGEGYVDMGRVLSSAMNSNEYFRVYVACGYYDLCTPYYSAMYSMNHLNIDDSRRDNVVFGFYKGGHMMYTNYSELKKLKKDVSKFYKAGGKKEEKKSEKGEQIVIDKGNRK